MPWSASDASRKTRKANTPAKRRKWKETANAVLAETGDDAKAIRVANAAVKKRKGERRG